jgi:uncharacterized membrane protein
MIPFAALLQHSLLYGAILSLVMSGVIFASFFLFPRIWVNSAPADIQQIVGAMTPHDQRVKRIARLLTLIFAFGLIVHSISQLVALGDGKISFSQVALSVFLIIQVFNLVDLLLIDWLLIATIRPSFVVFPGTEHLAGYRDYGFYFVGFLKGIIGSAILSLVVAAITQALLLLAGS